MLFVTNYECFVINQQFVISTLRQIIRHKICSEF